MNDPVYPVHLRRRFEQRWAARFGAAAVVKQPKLRKNAAKAVQPRTTIATNPIVKKAS